MRVLRRPRRVVTRVVRSSPGPMPNGFSLGELSLVIEGDSQSDPAYNASEWGTTAWSTLLAAAEPTATVWIEAITESRVAFEIAARAEDEVDSKINPAKVNVALLWAGTNDMFDGASAAATLAAVEDWVDGRRLAGFALIVVMNCPERDNLSNTTRNTFNAGLSGVGADLVIDIATVVGTPGQSDGTHFTQAEHNAIRDAVHAALEGAFA